MRVLLTKMRDLQGFRRKKRPCKISLAGSFLSVSLIARITGILVFQLKNLTLVFELFYKLGLPQIKIQIRPFCS